VRYDLPGVLGDVEGLAEDGDGAVPELGPEG